MAKFRLLAGRHVGKGGRIYNVGDVVESPVDLVTLCGAEKFARVDGKPSASRNAFPVTPNSVTAPGGQVHSGKQETGGEDEDGEPVSGAMEEETNPATEAALAGESVEGDEEELDLNALNVSQLKELAEEREVDVTGAKTKAQLIAKLQG